MKLIYKPILGLGAIFLLSSCPRGYPLVLLPERSIGATEQQSARFGNPSEQSLAAMPFELSGNQIFIPVRVNGSKPLWFVLDSGASAWVIDRAHADSLGLKFEGKGQGKGAGSGTFDVAFVKNVTFGLSETEVAVPIIGAIDLSNNLSQVGREINGLIGYDFFEKFVVEIDYDSRILRLYDPKAYNYSGPGESIPLTVEKRLPYIVTKLTVSGREATDRRLLIDTGSNDAVDDSMIAQSSSPIIETIGGVGQGKEFKIVEGRVRELKLGSLILEDAVGGAGGVPLIGGEVLRRFTVIFDYSRQRMILEPNQHVRDAFLWDTSGTSLRLMPESGYFRIHSVLKDSPATNAGLREGDLIQAIDGLSSKYYSLQQLERLFRRAGAEHRLSVRRGDESMQVNIKLRKML